MRRAILKMPICSVFLVLLLLLGGLSSASATEYSVWDWWTNNQGAGGMTDLDGNTIVPSWTDTLAPYDGGQNEYKSWSVDTLWDQLTGVEDRSLKETWTTTEPGGWFHLEVEWAGYRGGNEFGWYSPTGADPTASQMHPIFEGADAQGATETPSLSSAAFAFYLKDPSGNVYYSEEALNSFRQVRVFVDPQQPQTWILAWEDLPANAGNASAVWTDASSLAWANPTEPDFDDMIVRCQVVSEGGAPTPELSTFLLMGLSLAAIPVMRRRRRS